MKKSTLFTTLLAVIFFAACNNHSSYTSLTPEEFKASIEKSNTQLVDVRTAEEHSQGHISGSVNIDVKQEGFVEKAVATLNKKETVALYCRSGRRSKTAATQLSKAGFTVVELDGGYNSWQEKEALSIAYEIKYLLHTYTQKATSIAASEEREELINNLLSEFSELCTKHEKALNTIIENNEEFIEELQSNLDKFIENINQAKQ